MIFIVSSCLISCHRSEKVDLVGTWRWISTTGGIAGVYYTPVSENMEVTLVFTNGMFHFYKNGEEVAFGRYTLYHDESVISGNDSQLWMHIPEKKSIQMLEATEGKITIPSKCVVSFIDHDGVIWLGLGESVCDGFGYSFEKL